jgi:hypothetical protein
MLPSFANPDRVLLFGRDETLLCLRALVLRSAHLAVDITIDMEAFRMRIADDNCRYGVVISCYTVADAEREEIIAITARSGIAMLQLDSLILPPALIARVSALLALQ